MENLNDTKMNRMLSSALEIHHNANKGINMSHLLPQTLHVLEDGSGLQMVMKPPHLADNDSVLRLGELMKDLKDKGILSNGVSPHLLSAITKNLSQTIKGQGLSYSHSGKGSGKIRKRHRGGNLQIGSLSGGDLSKSLLESLVPTLIKVAPHIVKSILNLPSQGFKQTGKDIAHIGKEGLKTLAQDAISREVVGTFNRVF